MLYFVYHADKPASLETRLANREAHLAYIKQFKVLFAGPTMNPATGTMDGSMLVVDLPDQQALDEFMNNDPYSQAGLFERSIAKPWKQVVPGA